MLVIKQGRVLDPFRSLDEVMDLKIADGRIVEMGQNLDGKQVIDAAGCIVCPSLMDLHVHFRDPGFTYKEDLISGAKAAAKGGFCDVVCMANTKPVIDQVAELKKLQQRAEECAIHVLFASALSKGFQGKELVDMKAMRDAGAVFFTDDGLPVQDEWFLEKAMREAEKLDVMLSFHEEDTRFIKQAGINAGEAAAAMGLQGADRQAEIVMVARDIALARKTGAHIHIQHISAKEAVALVKQAKEEGLAVSAEATPHHFSMTEQDVLKYHTMAKMNPPLRTEEDRMAIIEGLKTGVIDVIASDHAPHSKEEKDREFTKAPSGIIGLETSLAAAYTYLVKPKHLTLMQLLQLMSRNPAQLIHRKRTIQLQEAANLIIWNEHEQLDTSTFVSKSQNSPYIDQKLYGTVIATICDGSIVYQKDAKKL